MSAPCFIYAAKSTKDRHLSIPEQLEDCREMAAANGWTILGEFADEGFTAFSGNRGPGLAAAIDAAKRAAAERGGEVYLVAQHTSRFARGDGAAPGAPRALVELWHEWARAGVRGRTVENDSAMSSSANAAAQGEADHNESKRKSRSVTKGLRRRARDRGKLAGGPPPYGYRWADGELEVIPAEVAVVRRIFEESVAGRSQSAIARALNRDGIKPGRAERWIQASVRRVLTNPIYVGQVRHDGEVYAGKQEAVLDRDVWDAAQAIRGAAAATRNNGGGRSPRGSHLFTKGLLRCACGSAMVPRTNARRLGPSREPAPGTVASEVYLCLGRYRDPESCNQKPVRREVIDAAMVAELDKRYLDLAATRERYAAKRTADAALAAEALAGTERDLARLDADLTRIRRDYREGKISADDWAGFRDEMGEEREAAEAALARARSQAEAGSDADVTDEVLDRLRDLRAAVLGGLDRAPDLDALRRLLREMFETVTYLPGPGGQGASLVFGLRWDALDLDALDALDAGKRPPGGYLDAVLRRRALPLDPARTSEREGLAT